MEQKFLCYTSGILSGKAIIGETGIKYAKYSYYNGEFSEYNNVSSSDFLHLEIQNLWLKGQNLQWNKEKISFSTFHYEANTNFNGGTVFAQMYSNSPVDIVVVNEKMVGFMLPSRNESVTLIIEGFEKYTNLSLWADDKISKAEYDIKVLGCFMVPMADGTKLATDVVLPCGKEGQTYPTILIRTCYNKNINCEMWHKYAKRGYAVVVQDVRGREASEGEWTPFYYEIDDGGDTLDWIAAQSWSDGSVGMIGGSYLGYVQWAAAASGNKHLKALVSQVTAGSAFFDLPRRGGTFESGILAWSFMVADKATNPKGCVRDDWDSILAHKPICDIPHFTLGENIEFYDKWMSHENDGEFWKKSDWSLHQDKINVPALYISGWFDDNGQGTTQSWEMNAKNKRENQRMILGPWLHKTNSSRQIHDFVLPKNSLRYDLDVLYIKWLDHFLKGIENNIEKLPPVQYYMLGENQWKTAESWPPVNSEYTNLYLHNNPGHKKANLSLVKSEEIDAASYTFDPQHPFPVIIDVSENEGAIPGNYNEAEKRSDVLLFTSDILNEDLAIAGVPVAEIYAASDCLDTDWVVRITDLDEHENSFKISDGIIRARYRNSYSQPQLLTSGKIEKYTITLTKIAHTFLKGHKIRVQVTSGADNFCFANSNTGGNEATTIHFKIAHQTLYTGKEYRSHIKFPVIK